jgi:hypothetical protein
VAEEFLNDAKIGAAFDEVRGVGVAKRVRMHVTTQHTMIENSSYVARPDPTGPSIQEQRFRG